MSVTRRIKRGMAKNELKEMGVHHPNKISMHVTLNSFTVDSLASKHIYRVITRYKQIRAKKRKVE